MKILSKIAENFKDMRVLCNSCHYEGLVNEFTNGCPKCGELKDLVPKTPSGNSFEEQGAKRKVNGIKILWLTGLSTILFYAAQRFLEYKYFIIIVIFVLVLDFIIYLRGEK